MSNESGATGSHRLEIAIPSGVSQDDLYQLEEDLQVVLGEKQVRLEEPKDLIAAIGLILHVTSEAAGYVGTGVGAVVTIKETAKKLHQFLHPAEKKDAEDEAARRRAVLKLDGEKQLELYGYSVEDLEKLLTDPGNYLNNQA